MKVVRFPVIGTLVLAAACGEAAPPPAVAVPGVTILAPTGAALIGDSVTVRLRAEGIAIVPATGSRVEGEAHHHLFVDADVTPEGEAIPRGEGIHHLGTGADSLRIGLAPGTHRLIAVLAWGDHVPVAGAARDTVVLTIEAPAGN